MVVLTEVPCTLLPRLKVLFTIVLNGIPAIFTVERICVMVVWLLDPLTMFGLKRVSPADGVI